MKYFVLSILVAFLFGCSLPPNPSPVIEEVATEVRPTITATILATNTQSVTSTVTPSPEPEIIPTGTTQPKVYWTPSAASLTEIPAPVEQISEDNGEFNLVILGSDARPSAPGLRTDTIMYVSFNRSSETVTIVSFPRDLYVYIPGWKMWRINGAWNQGGMKMLSQTLLYNFGLEVDKYILVDFSGFTGIINSVGGIDVKAGNSFVDECRGVDWSYLADETYHMDGDEALCYVRMRAATSDFARKERQTEIIVALFRKIGTSRGFSNIPELYDEYTNSVETNIGLAQMGDLAPIALKFLQDDWRVRSYTITEDFVTHWRTPDEQAVLLPKVREIQKLLEEALTN